jgi:hypothetical protein
MLRAPGHRLNAMIRRFAQPLRAPSRPYQAYAWRRLGLKIGQFRAGFRTVSANVQQGLAPAHQDTA